MYLVCIVYICFYVDVFSFIFSSFIDILTFFRHSLFLPNETLRKTRKNASKAKVFNTFNAKVECVMNRTE